MYYSTVSVDYSNALHTKKKMIFFTVQLFIVHSIVLLWGTKNSSICHCCKNNLFEPWKAGFLAKYEGPLMPKVPQIQTCTVEGAE